MKLNTYKIANIILITCTLSNCGNKDEEARREQRNYRRREIEATEAAMQQNAYAAQRYNSDAASFGRDAEAIAKLSEGDGAGLLRDTAQHIANQEQLQENHAQLTSYRQRLLSEESQDRQSKSGGGFFSKLILFAVIILIGSWIKNSLSKK